MVTSAACGLVGLAVLDRLRGGATNTSKSRRSKSSGDLDHEVDQEAALFTPNDGRLQEANDDRSFRAKRILNEVAKPDAQCSIIQREKGRTGIRLRKQPPSQQKRTGGAGAA